jgi:hypothetical protein
MEIVSHAQIQTEIHVQNVKLVFILNQTLVSSVKAKVWHVLERDHLRDVKMDIIWQSHKEVHQVFANLVIAVVRLVVQYQLNAHHVQTSTN